MSNCAKNTASAHIINLWSHMKKTIVHLYNEEVVKVRLEGSRGYMVVPGMPNPVFRRFSLPAHMLCHEVLGGFGC